MWTEQRPHETSSNEFSEVYVSILYLQSHSNAVQLLPPVFA